MRFYYAGGPYEWSTAAMMDESKQEEEWMWQEGDGIWQNRETESEVEIQTGIVKREERYLTGEIEVLRREETRSDKREMGTNTRKIRALTGKETWTDRRGDGIWQERRHDLTRETWELTGEETGSDRRGDMIWQERHENWQEGRLDLTGETWELAGKKGLETDRRQRETGTDRSGTEFESETG